MSNQDSSQAGIFNEWNEKKKSIDIFGSQRKVIFHERQVWWCSLGKNIGDEQDGKHALFERPVLILKKFNERIAWIIPLSSKIKYGNHYYIFTLNKKLQRAIISQSRLVSAKRFQRKVGDISKDDFRKIRSKIIQLV